MDKPRAEGGEVRWAVWRWYRTRTGHARKRLGNVRAIHSADAEGQAWEMWPAVPKDELFVRLAPPPNGKG